MLECFWQLAPIGVLFMKELISLVITPLFVGIVIERFAYWLDKQVVANPHVRSRNERKKSQPYSQ